MMSSRDSWNDQGQQPTQSGFEFLPFLNRRKSFIVFFSLIGVGLSYLYFQKQQPEFRSDAWVQVIHRNADPRMKTMLADKDLADADYVIKSDKVLSAAFDRHNLKDLSVFSGMKPEEAVAKLIRMISTKIASAAVVQISATGRDPSETQRIADAVAAEYLALQRSNYEDASEELKSLLVRARDEIHESLKKAESDHAEFRKNSRLTVDGQNPHAAREQLIRERITVLELEKTALESEFTTLQKAIANGGNREAVMLLIGKQTANTSANKASSDAVESSVSSARTLAEAILPLMLQESELLQSLGPDHPKVKLIRSQIEHTRGHYRELANLTSATSTEDSEPAQDFLSIYLESLSQEIEVSSSRIRDLESKAMQEQSLARSLSQDVISDRNKLSEIARLQKLFDETALHLSEIKVNSDIGGVTAQVLAPAKHGSLVYPIFSKFLGMGAFLGAIAGLVVAYAIELADRSFRKPEELLREFNLPILGHIPFMEDSALKGSGIDHQMDKTVVLLQCPSSRVSESYRTVRTAIRFSSVGVDHRVLMVTSPSPGDGKSTLAANLAVSLSQAGKKVVLVECDLRRPRVHKITGVNNSGGISDVLENRLELGDALRSTDVPNLSVLPVGTRPKNPSELLSGDAFSHLVEVLREKFDVVIIDSPPVLAVADASIIAPRADGVLLCVRLSKMTRILGRRAIDQLQAVGGQIMGLVVNGVTDTDSYGITEYRYREMKPYGQGYDYADDPYFSEPAVSNENRT